ncbi:MAG TPA: glycosyltransferase family 2 protein [Thermoanaerobaculia bacterium]|jgi:hypothetical protein
MQTDQSQKPLSVCVVSYNSFDIVRLAIDSIYGTSDDLVREIIVVDNDSNDGTPDRIQQTYPDVQVIRNHSNEGYAPAMNIALAASRGDYVMTLSHDAELKPGAAAALLEFLRSHPRAGLAGPRTIDGNGEVVTTLHHPSLMLRTWSEIIPVKPWLKRRPALRRFIGRVYPNSSGLTSDYSTTHRAPVIDGGCVMMKRATLDAVGLLDEKLMQGPDDYDLCYRVSRAGFETWYVAEAEIVHKTYDKDDVSLLSPTYLRTQLPQASYLYGKYHGRVLTAFFCGSAYLLALKWRRQVVRLYGKESAHMNAVTEGAAFCLSPSRYEREYRALWARPA